MTDKAGCKGAITIVLVDDQALVRDGIARILKAQPDVDIVAEAPSGEEAVDCVFQHRPQVVVMDLRMPGIGGIEATRRILEVPCHDNTPARVLMLTTYHADEDVDAALRAGAAGYVLKDAVPQDLVTAIRAVAAGNAWMDPSVTRRLLARFLARPEYSLVDNADLSRLTARELEVLVFIAYGLSNTEIAQRFVVAEATVKTHVGRILSKLGARDRAQLVAWAYQHRLVIPGTPPPEPRH